MERNAIFDIHSVSIIVGEAEAAALPSSFQPTEIFIAHSDLSYMWLRTTEDDVCHHQKQQPIYVHCRRKTSSNDIQLPLHSASCHRFMPVNFFISCSPPISRPYACWSIIFLPINMKWDIGYPSFLSIRHRCVQNIS